MNDVQKIYFIGFMSSGKTTWANRLSESLGMRFIDLDEEIEMRTGVSITTLFHDYGEAYFRKQEQAALEDLSRLETGFVMATGGGTASYMDNMDVMRTGISIYLSVSCETLLKRLIAERSKRPLIAHLDETALQQFIERTVKLRERFYELADIIVDEEELKLQDLLGLINDQLK